MIGQTINLIIKLKKLTAQGFVSTISNLLFQIINDPKVLTRRLTTLFSFGCFVLATYYTITQVVRFLQNKDTSTITHKTFNEMPENRYPTFSICFKGKEIYWNIESFLFERSGMTSAQYVDFLKGVGWQYEYDEVSRLYKKVYHNDSAFTSIQKRNVQDNLLYKLDIIVGTYFFARDHVGKAALNEMGIPFYVGHRSPDEICLTRNSMDEFRSTRLYDEVWLNQSILNIGNQRNLKAKIIFHYPGQLVKDIEKPAYQVLLKEIKSTKTVFEQAIRQVSVFKNRPDSNLPCYDGDLSDDARFRHEAIRTVDCMPSYWKDLDVGGIEKELCQSKDQLKLLYDTTSSYKRVASTYDFSCIGMDTLVTNSKTLRKAAQHITFRINYMDDSYQETENFRDFNFESFFSSLGGFIGIFLGYSMLQIPELLSSIRSVEKRGTCFAFKGKISLIPKDL